MSDHLDPTDAGKSGEALPPSGSGTRRRLLKGTVGAAPILLTLASRSALGTNSGGGTTGGQCTTPSAFGSLTGSIPDKISTCSGISPGYWKQEKWFSQWPASYYPTTVGGPGGHPATKFHEHFSGGTFDTKTLLAVMRLQGGGDIALGRHVAAALLNAASGKTPVLTVGQVQNIWNEYLSQGYFEPIAGIKWGASDIVTYLKSTYVHGTE